MRSILLGISLLAPAVAQGSIQATLTALQSIDAEWINAPPGTPGTLVSQPAGTLSQFDVSGPAGSNWAHVFGSLSQNGPRWQLTATSQVFSPLPELAETRADLLLQLTSSAATTIVLDLRLAHWGDMPSNLGLQLDVDDDGSIELDSNSPFCCGSVRRLTLTRTIDTAPLLVRIRHRNTMSASPQAYDLWIDAQPWLTQATPVGTACAALGVKQPPAGYYDGNYQLAALPSNDPQEFGVLRANGLGTFDLFFFSDVAAVAPLLLPPPLPGPCDLLAGILIAAPGTPTVTSPATSEWELRIPLLPPGLVLYAQHASVHSDPPFGFGASNVLRLDT